MDGMLSQDEINALFNNVGDTDDTEIETPVDDGETLTEEQKDAIGEVSNISMGTAATTLSTLLNQPVNITTPNVTYMMWDELAESYDKPCVFLQIKYTFPLLLSTATIFFFNSSLEICCSSSLAKTNLSF